MQSDILDTVDTFDVRPYLFERGIISLAEYEETSCRRITCQPIINILYKHSPSDLPFTHLRLAMQERYPHLVEKIDASTVGKAVCELTSRGTWLFCLLGAIDQLYVENIELV